MGESSLSNSKLVRVVTLMADTHEEKMDVRISPVQCEAVVSNTTQVPAL